MIIFTLFYYANALTICSLYYKI